MFPRRNLHRQVAENTTSEAAGHLRPTAGGTAWVQCLTEGGRWGGSSHCHGQGILPCTVRVTTPPPPGGGGSDIFHKRLGILVQILHACYTFLSTLDNKFLFNYLHLWISYATLSATTQRAFRRWWTLWAYDVNLGISSRALFGRAKTRHKLNFVKVAKLFLFLFLLFGLLLLSVVLFPKALSFLNQS